MLSYPKNRHSFESRLFTSLFNSKCIFITIVQTHQLKEIRPLNCNFIPPQCQPQTHTQGQSGTSSAKTSTPTSKCASNTSTPSSTFQAVRSPLFKPNSQRLIKNTNKRKKATLTPSSTTPNTSKPSSPPSQTSSTRNCYNTTSPPRPSPSEVHPTRAL